jgi:hypothetical protein
MFKQCLVIANFFFRIFLAYLFWKNRVCLWNHVAVSVCVCVCVCIPLIIARQRLGRNVTAVTNTCATIEELCRMRFPQSWLWRVSSSGIWRHVVCWVATDVSGEHIASIFRITLKMEAISSSETSVATQHLQGDPEDGGDMFLRNVGCNSTDYMVSYPRRWYSSKEELLDVSYQRKCAISSSQNFLFNLCLALFIFDIRCFHSVEDLDSLVLTPCTLVDGYLPPEYRVSSQIHHDPKYWYMFLIIQMMAQFTRQT